MYDRNALARANASASLSASSSMVPFRVWIWLPPSSFLS
jgi:hypothetical protein